ncbi:ABC-type tungstate transport system, periplasmic component [Clostridium aceticum]|uniref:ABC-type tungstate transport system, periplasmic component n=1 Tax=Clostridium aceticum TaxID=84022 RepID=A0A0D8IEJ8_9CLOT|nr:extracellular solute-binding protein [Clostridium aceticum]AKL94378.1 ABC-type tungstate transport system, periplasmic component [Clostridium aceticum]KJF28392.1 tungsten ABC transporter substrate-binding protein [Clostridium aceticum]
MSLKKSKSFLIVSFVLVLMMIFVGCAGSPQEAPPAEETPQDAAPQVANTNLLLSTTTSTENSGLLDAILPVFEKETGIEVKVVAVGTGQALQMGKDGEADVLLVHAKASEEEFVAEGHGVERFEVMYNDFVLLGPDSDPAGVLASASNDILKAFQLVYDNQAPFVSRGDDSGTHKMELELWKELGLEPSGNWYVEAGQGMGAVIQMTDEMVGYTLTDRATYLSMKNNLELQVVTEGDTKLFNQYGIIAVNPDKNDKINFEAAEVFIDWMLSEKGQQLIGEFGKAEYGEPLFIPNAK